MSIVVDLFKIFGNVMQLVVKFWIWPLSYSKEKG